MLAITVDARAGAGLASVGAASRTYTRSRIEVSVTNQQPPAAGAPRTQPTHDGREQWSGQLGFVLAAIGSAVGLGNIWRFPGVAYDSGGGAFLVPYLVALLTAGIPILWLDYAVGHRFRGSAPAALRRVHRGLEPLGWFQVFLAFAISLYYTVILAWAGSYAVFSFSEAWGDDPAAFFGTQYVHAEGAGVSFDVVPGVLVPLVIAWVVTLGILAGGVKKGLERANKVFIPLLVVMFGALVVRAVTLEGAATGLDEFFAPRWSALTDPGVWVAAYSQIFFSLSIAFGIMITYSSYLRRRANLTSTGLVVGFANSSFELLAGIGVFSALGFMAAQSGVAVGDLENITGVNLAFVAFPQIISLMPASPVFGVLFFGSLVLAGLTSLVSVLQVVIAAVQDKFDLPRLTAVLVVGLPAAGLSIALFSTTTGVPLLDTVDAFVNEVGILGSAVLTTILLGWVLRRLPELQAHLNQRAGLHVGAWWRWLVGVVVPVVLGYILVSGVVELVRDGYGGGEYPDWFVVAFGWGSVALAALLGVVLGLAPWRHDRSGFTPEPLTAAALRGARRPEPRPTTAGGTDR